MPVCIARTIWVACVTLAVLALQTPLLAQTAEQNAVFKVAVVDKDLAMKSVPKFVLLIGRQNDPAFAEKRISTSLDGTAAASLPPGVYTVKSERPLEFENKTFAWQQ